MIVAQNLRDPSGEVRPLAWDLAKRISRSRWQFQGERIWCQNTKPLGIWGYPKIFVPNYHHHYCLIFRKRELPVMPPDDADLIHWAPRVPKEKIRRLYEQEAQGILDEELLDEVGFCSTYAARAFCRPRRRGGAVSAAALRDGDRAAGPARRVRTSAVPELRVVAAVAAKYAKTFRRKQLNTGGAGKVFQGYIEQYERAHDPPRGCCV